MAIRSFARIFPLLALLAGCRQQTPTSLLLTVMNGADAPGPDVIGVRVFDGYGQAHDVARFAAPRSDASGRFGTVVIYPRREGSLSLRVQAQGLRQDALVSEGTTTVLLISGQQSPAQVILRGASRVADLDGDGVSDDIDNCPDHANPDQTDANGDGLADGCSAPDGGVADAAEGGGRPVGASCVASAECSDGFCVGGVCCESACADTCRGCNLPGREGRCAPVAAGAEDPHGRCQAEPPESCGLDGTCNGAGACRKHRPGTVCRLGSCTSSAERVLPSTCDGNGLCAPGTPQPCAPFVCAGTECRTTCAGPQDCAGGRPCIDGSCGRKALGTPCATDPECNSNHCVDGVCCDVGECSGPCRACNLPGAEGSCQSFVANAEPRSAGCAMEPVSSCGRTGKCDGSGGCQLYPRGTVCGARTCTGSSETGAPLCDGSGTCAPGTSQSCGNYLCLGDRCSTSCTSDGHCVTGTYCGGRNLCRVREGSGAACTEGRECLSGQCLESRCL